MAHQLGEKSEYYQLDVQNEGDWIEVSNLIKTKYGKLDILVNNAGITGFLETKGTFDAENVDIDSLEEVHKVNAIGTMLGCKYAITLMKERWRKYLLLIFRQEAELSVFQQPWFMRRVKQQFEITLKG